MAITVEQAIERCGTDESDETEVLRCLVMANDLIEQVLVSAWRPVPVSVEDECVLRATHNLFHQSETAGVNDMYASADGTGLPNVANDPLRKCWPLLLRYLPRV